MSNPKTTPEHEIWTSGYQLKVGDKIQMTITIYPKWWQFWKKPHDEIRAATVTKVGSYG